MAKKNALDILDEIPATKKKPTVKVVEVAPIKKNTAQARKYPDLVDEDPVRAYVVAAAEAKKAQARMKEIEPYLKEVGLRDIFETNTGKGSKDLIASVRLVDVPEPGVEQVGPPEAVLMSVKDQYAAFDNEQVTAILGTVTTVDGKPAKVEDYLGWAVSADFNVKVFNDPATGKFSAERFKAFRDALEEVAGQFGVKNPLECGKVRTVAEDFHQRRFVDFKLETNLALQTVLPATTALKAE